MRGAEFAGQRVGVLGLARSGLALARILTALGARVLLSDTRTREQLGEALSQLGDLDVDVELGGHTEALLDCDMVVISPGVSIHHPLLQRALAAGVPVVGEVEVAYRLCPVPFLAVTGTNGKSTTSSLLARMLGPRAVLAGNIGTPLVSEVTRLGPEVAYVVAEISSFQLETIHRFRPQVAVLTNITPDHLDRHRDLAEYVAAKARLFAYQGPECLALFNQDDPVAAELADRLEGGGLPAWLDGFPPPAIPPVPRVQRYSCRSRQADYHYADGYLHGPQGPLLEWDFANLPGPHNLSNALAAVSVAGQLGCSVAEMRAAMQGYSSLHHRLEHVASCRGVRFVDDSKATNVASVRAALETYSVPITLIAGGRDKGLDLDELGQEIARRCHHLVAIGEAADPILEAARRHGLTSLEKAPTMPDAVRAAFLASRPGGVVLLSPACTSFDMFKNAEDRGDQFRAAVLDLVGSSEFLGENFSSIQQGSGPLQREEEV